MLFPIGTIRVFIALNREMPAKMTEGQIGLHRPALVDLKAGLTLVLSPCHSDPGPEVGLTKKSRRFIADSIATDA